MKTLKVKKWFYVPSNFTGVAECRKGKVRKVLYQQGERVAIELFNGTKKWYQNGKCVAIEKSDGEKSWLLDGMHHRDDGPALITPNGIQKWYQYGKCHRDNEPAVIYRNGTKYWYREGKQHRDDGPAVEYASGAKLWYQNGKIHRLDGAAIECENWQQYYQVLDSIGESPRIFRFTNQIEESFNIYYVFNVPLTKDQFERFRAMWTSTLSQKNNKLLKSLLGLAKLGEKISNSHKLPPTITTTTTTNIGTWHSISLYKHKK